MRAEPAYRVRLFMSIDLIGSTSLKIYRNERGSDQPKDAWVKQINHFYSDFLKNLLHKYDMMCRGAGNEAYKEKIPKLWKTLGDELIVCLRVVDLLHLKVAIRSFLSALADYGYYLDEQQSELDVKGSAWVCSFPDPNITLQNNNEGGLYGGQIDQLTDESLESEADRRPYNFDFLGTHVDAGFRLSKFASRDGFAVTAELAYLLGRCCMSDIGAFSFDYLGLKEIKGLLNNAPYPVFLLDSERRNERRLSRSLEWDLLGKSLVPGHRLIPFLDALFDQNKIEAPRLPTDFRCGTVEPPESHKEYVSRWRDDNKARTASVQTEDKDTEQEEQINIVDSDVASGADKLSEAFSRLQRAADDVPAVITPSVTPPVSG